MKVLFLLLLLSSSAFAGFVTSKVSVKDKRNEVRDELMQESQTHTGKKEKIYENGDLRFYASIAEFKDKLPEMPAGTPVIIYGEVFKGDKLIGRPQIITLLGHEATFSSESKTGEFYEIKITPTKLTP